MLGFVFERVRFGTASCRLGRPQTHSVAMGDLELLLLLCWDESPAWLPSFILNMFQCTGKLK